MRINRAWSWDSRTQNRGSKLSPWWLLRCLALPMLTALWCVSAAAQCRAYVPTHKSNSVAVIEHRISYRHSYQHRGGYGEWGGGGS
jgi:hypothetical protein